MSVTQSKRRADRKLKANLRREKYALVARTSQVDPDGSVSHDEDWFRAPVPRKTIRGLMRREDGAAIRDTLIWLGLILLTGVLGVYLWPSWVAIPIFLIYGTLYASAADARAHECGHGTPFATPWLNTAVFNLATFLIMEDPTVTRWRHTLHHTDTIVAGRDPEILAMRPARLARIMMEFFGLVGVPRYMGHMLRHASGRLVNDEYLYVPESERHKVYRTARIWTLIYLTVIVACFAFGSVLPIILVGGPRIYGWYMRQIYTLTQHTGMAEDVMDHRLNTRTVYMNPINRFLYWNMNYHLEHHLFPMVPYHRLADLHDEIKGELPPPYESIFAVYREIIPAVIRQLNDQTYFIYRELPAGATPFRTSSGSADE